MALVPYTITAIERDVADADASGKQVIVGAICSMYTLADDIIVLLYDDAAGNNGATSKTTGANGQVTVYINPGEYRVSVNSQNSFILLGSSDQVGTISNTETQALTAGQTFVTLASLTTTQTAFYISGLNADNGRLTLGFDYSVTSTSQITLAESYPAGTRITAVQNEGAGAGASGSFTTVDSKTVTVLGGIITSII